MKRRGVTLTEILVVIVITFLLMALIFPVFGKARKASLTVPCTSNLRQIHIAVASYQESYDGKFPINFSELLVEVPVVRTVLACPADKTTGANSWVTERAKAKESYYFIETSEEFRKAIAEADPNHGIAYCVLHGQKIESDRSGDFRLATKGLVLRLRIDGSVQRVHVGHWCSPKTINGQSVGRQAWSLLSDTHCVEPHCEGLTEPCVSQ